MVVEESTVVSVEDLYVNYGEMFRERAFSIGKVREIRGLGGVSFDVKNGERIAIIGRNGAGKSTLLKCLAGFLRPSKGNISTSGRVIYLAGVDPGFDSELTGRGNVEQLALAYGIPVTESHDFTDSVKDFTELDEAFERKYGGYSSGMKSKLGFGFISGLRSDLLLIDETFGAGDREFRKKSRSRMNEMVDNIPTVIMCSHGMGLVSSICDRGIVLDLGKVVFDGPVNEAIEYYEKMTADSINWIEFPYQFKTVTEDGVIFDYDEEFAVKEEMRLVIHDNKIKKFIHIEELEIGEDVRMSRKELPEHLDCMFKLQQFRDGKWYDASRYVRFSEEKIDAVER